MFWQTLPRPILVLAPMEDVTDFVFRQVLQAMGRPPVYVTEFAQAQGIADGRRDSLQRLLHHPSQKPIVAQIWGNNPESYRQAVLRIRQAGFDGVDINMGCPQPKIAAKGYCAGLINQPTLASELLLAAKEAATTASPEAQGCPAIPVSVKTRIGFTHPPKVDTAQRWFETLLATKPAVLTVHGRTAEQQSDGLADWSFVRLATQVRQQHSPQTLVLGNGDITSQTDAYERIALAGCDGAMVGRGIFSNPLLFAQAEFATLPRAQKLSWALYHLNLYEDFWGSGRNYEVLKKFFKIYLSGFDDALTLRETIMATHTYQASRTILRQAGAISLE